MPTFNNDPVVSDSNSPNTPAVQGEGSGYEGVRGVSHNGHGGVVGINDWAPPAPPGAGGNGGWFESSQGEGVRGWAKTPHHGGVVGVNTAGGFGVYGQSDGSGVVGESKTWMGVYGRSESTKGGAGVIGEAVGTGVIGKSQTWMGVYGETESTTGGAGVWGEHKANGIGTGGKSAGGIGVWGMSDTHEGMHAETKSTVTAALAAYQMNAASGTAAFFAKHMGNHTAGRFEGDVEVTGDIRLTNADCAEDFNIGTDVTVEPGTVMVLGEEGALFPSQHAYDKRVVGVVSGAGDYKPGLVLDKQESQKKRQPIALLGKVYCKVDAQYGAVEIGDLLTTSSTMGHAMKATDPARAFGAVIGKALQPLAEGDGEIAILIALQ